MSDPNEMPPIRITVEIPSALALEFQKQSLRAGVDGAVQAQTQFFDWWMKAGVQGFAQITQAMQLPFLPPPGSGSGRG